MSEATTTAFRLVAEALQVAENELSEDASIHTESHWDSLAHMRLMLALETEMGCQLEPTTIIELTSLRSIASFISADPGRAG